MGRKPQHLFRSRSPKKMGRRFFDMSENPLGSSMSPLRQIVLETADVTLERPCKKPPWITNSQRGPKGLGIGYQAAQTFGARKGRRRAEGKSIQTETIDQKIKLRFSSAWLLRSPFSKYHCP